MTGSLTQWLWLMLAICPATLLGQSYFLARQPADGFFADPAVRIGGDPGSMRMLARDCQSPSAGRDGQLRERIVQIALQEWAYFGFSVYDLTDETSPDYAYRRSWRSTHIDPSEAERVAASIAGYWSATPNSAWILEEQNQRWRQQGPGVRWRNPWSAAFISWVMCESGLTEGDQFQRAIAHVDYIDQAIDARDGRATGAKYLAYDVGETDVAPGDLLCRGSRPAYSNIAERRRQRGVGARSHCDIVVRVDTAGQRFLMIGGNVRGWVRMKLLPGEPGEQGLRPAPFGGRTVFAHLKLDAAPTAKPILEDNQILAMMTCARVQVALPALSVSGPMDCSQPESGARSSANTAIGQ